MAKREIDNIDDQKDDPKETGDIAWVDQQFEGVLGEDISVAPKMGPKTPPAEKKINLHYPEATYLNQVLKDVAIWSDFNFVIEPSLNRQIQIFAPRKLDQKEAFQLFVASLESSGLRVLQMGGSTVKIVPMTFGKVGI